MVGELFTLFCANSSPIILCITRAIDCCICITQEIDWANSLPVILCITRAIDYANSSPVTLYQSLIYTICCIVIFHDQWLHQSVHQWSFHIILREFFACHSLHHSRIRLLCLCHSSNWLLEFFACHSLCHSSNRLREFFACHSLSIYHVICHILSHAQWLNQSVHQ